MNMSYIRFILVVMFLISTGSIYAQDLSDHLWNDRLLVVYTVNDASELYKQQIDELQKDKMGLDDRKLVLYSITPSHVKKGWDYGEWEVRNKPLDDFLSEDGNFEVVLIGLDGKVKLRQDQLLKRERLFKTIDSMPMRQHELRSRDE
jgi:hypothetical protein